ncbi:MAG: universal stress protein [Promethearchaeota archaeon]
MLYNKILVGVDESEDAMETVNKALEFKERKDSEVIIFHSFIHDLAEISPSFSLVRISNPSVSLIIHEDNVNQGKNILKKVEKIFKKVGKEIRTRLIFDIPSEDYILKGVSEENFDLVILGCKGKHSKLKRVFLGTKPNKVINNANCDVLIVR